MNDYEHAVFLIKSAPDAVRSEMERRNLFASQVARQIGIAESTFHSFLTRKKVPSQPVLVLIIGWLGASEYIE